MASVENGIQNDGVPVSWTQTVGLRVEWEGLRRRGDFPSEDPCISVRAVVCLTNQCTAMISTRTLPETCRHHMHDEC